MPNAALQELAAGDWTLVIANVGMTGLGGPSTSPSRNWPWRRASESGKARVRVLFLVPEAGGRQSQPLLERERPALRAQAVQPSRVFEKVSDLLMESGAIPQSIRQVRREGLTVGKRRDGGRMTARENRVRRRNTGMFANRTDYSSTTEEEITEYERQQKQQQEETRRKKKNMKDLRSAEETARASCRL